VCVAEVQRVGPYDLSVRTAGRASLRALPVNGPQIEQKEAEPAEIAVDVREERLPFVDRRELHLDLDPERAAAQDVARPLQYVQLAALCVGLDEIDVFDAVLGRHVVERLGAHLHNRRDVEAVGLREGVHEAAVGTVDGRQSAVARDVERHGAASVVQRGIEERGRPVGTCNQALEFSRIGLESEDAQMPPRRQPVALDPSAGADVGEHQRVALVQRPEALGDEYVQAVHHQ